MIKQEQRRLYTFVVFILLLLSALPFLQVLTFNSIVYDDNTHIFKNALITAFSPKTLIQIWTQPYFGMYIPLTYSIWGVLSFFTQGPNTSLFHGINLFFHLINILLVFRFLRFIVSYSTIEQGSQTSDLNTIAWIGALLFGLHPTQVESVAWISAFKDSGSTCLLLISFLTYFQFQKPELEVKQSSNIKQRKNLKAPPFYSEKAWFLATFFYLLSLLTKPTGVIAAPLLVFLNYFIFKLKFNRSFRGLQIWAIFALLMIFVTHKLQMNDVAFEVPILLRPLISLDALSFYLRKLFFPFPLFPDYARSLRGLIENPILFFSWILPVGLFSITLCLRKRFPLLWGSYALWMIALLPVSGLVPFSFQNYSTVSDRYLYFPMIFACLAVCAVLQSIFNKYYLVLSTCILMLFFTLTFIQTSYWKDSFTLFNYAVEHGPRSTLSFNNLGMAYKDRHEMEKAAQNFLDSITTDPYNFRAQNNLGGAYIELGQYQKALDHFENLLKQYPTLKDSKALAPPILNNYGTLLTKMGFYKKAEEILEQALRLNPNNVSLLVNTGEVYFNTHQYEKCLKVAEAAYELDPTNPLIQRNLAAIQNVLSQSNP